MPRLCSGLAKGPAHSTQSRSALSRPGPHLMQVSLEPTPPAAFVALDACFVGVVGASPAASLALAVQLAASLQAEVAAGGGRLAAAPAAACCAVLLLCKSMLQQLAATLGHPQLAECAAPGCEEGGWLGGWQCKGSAGPGGAWGPLGNGWLGWSSCDGAAQVDELF
jgi:hypothetical protein